MVQELYCSQNFYIKFQRLPVQGVLAIRSLRDSYYGSKAENKRIISQNSVNSDERCFINTMLIQNNFELWTTVDFTVVLTEDRS